jgi:serine protease Do
MGHSGRSALALALLFVAPPGAAGETLGEVYRRVNPSVVVIRARGEEVTEQGMSRFREIGSGVLISQDGKIATAAHVVHTMNEVAVEFLGEEPVAARVIASEPRADISIIQVSTVPAMPSCRSSPTPTASGSATRSSSSAPPMVSAIR